MPLFLKMVCFGIFFLNKGALVAAILFRNKLEVDY